MNKWIRCQQENHKILRTGQLLHLATQPLPHGHSNRKNCKCPVCKAARNIGCENPTACRKDANTTLNSLPTQWDPRVNDNSTPANLEQARANNTQNKKDGKEVTFIKDNTAWGSPLNHLRVLAPTYEGCPPVTQISNPQNQNTDPDPECTMVLRSKVTQDKDHKYEILIHNEKKHTNTYIASQEPDPTNRTGIIEAVKYILDNANEDQHLLIQTRSKYLINLVSDDLEKSEERGWNLGKQSDLVQYVLHKMRSRTAPTSFQEITDNEPTLWEKMKELEEQMTDDLQRNSRTFYHTPDVTPMKYTNVQTGVKLSTATQSLLYKRINEKHLQELEIRRKTMINLDITRHTAAEIRGSQPLDEEIWKSMRSKDISVRARAFMWKMMHNAYKVGEYWDNIPGYEIRGHCHVCNTPETMEHTLTECPASGQETIWQLAEELWALRGLKWVKPRIGHILGCGLANFHPEKKKTRLTGANRLYAILISESAHLIWKIRCQWKIQDGASDDKIHTPAETRQKWVQTINRRLKLDCLATNKLRYGSKALRPSLVQKTWWGVLLNQGDLDEDWLKADGVLVGVVGRPKGRNR